MRRAPRSRSWPTDRTSGGRRRTKPPITASHIRRAWRSCMARSIRITTRIPILHDARLLDLVSRIKCLPSDEADQPELANLCEPGAGAFRSCWDLWLELRVTSFAVTYSKQEWRKNACALPSKTLLGPVIPFPASWTEKIALRQASAAA